MINETQMICRSKSIKKQIVLFAISGLLLTEVVNANDVISSDKFPIVNAYFKQYKGTRSISATEALLNEKCFIEANAFIHDKSKQKEVKVTLGDPESNKPKETAMVKSPDYGSAITALAACVKKTSNPIAAWEGLYIIKSFYGIDYKNNIDAYKSFSKVLYEDKSCEGFLAQGDIYKDGIGTKVNKKAALKIYKEGIKECVGDWHNVVLTMRANNISVKDTK
jgi:hypothetical protein